MRSLSFFLVSALFFATTTQAEPSAEIIQFVESRIPTELQQNEEYLGGSRDAEVKRIAEWIQVIQELHHRAIIARDGEAGRPFHFEGGGVLLGSLRGHPDLDNLPRQWHSDIFNDPSKNVIVAIRYSNGVRQKKHDLIPDVRGATLIFLQYNPKVALENQKITIASMPMTNGLGGNTLIGENVDKFVSFAEIQSRPGLLAKVSLLQFLIQNPDVRKPLTSAAFRVIENRLSEEYGSGHAYALTTGEAFKARIRLNDVGPSTWDKIKTVLGNLFRPDYLRERLYLRTRESHVQLTLELQSLPQQSATNVVENSGSVWSSPFRVADIIAIQPQIPNERLELIFDALNLSPSLTGFGQRPLGIAGRARSVLYDFSAQHRHAIDPNSDDGQAMLRYVVSRALGINAGYMHEVNNGAGDYLVAALPEKFWCEWMFR